MFSNTAMIVDRAAKAHEQEEQRAPQLAERHLVEHARKRDEHEAGTRPRLDAEREACRKDDQARHERHEGVEPRNAHGLARQPPVLVDVAAEDGHGAHADRHREERLAHGGEHRVGKRGPLLCGRGACKQLAEVGHEVESEPFSCTRQRDRAHAQHRQHGEQRNHHHLGDPLDSLLQACSGHCHAYGDGDQHERDHLQRIGQKPVVHRRDAGCVLSLERSHRAVRHEGQHPARHRGVEHHEQVVSHQGDPFEPMPSRPLRLQCVEAARDAFLTGTANGEFHDQDGKREHRQKHQEQQHERRTAVLSRDEGEPPHVAQPDGASRAYQYES